MRDPCFSHDGDVRESRRSCPQDYRSHAQEPANLVGLRLGLSRRGHDLCGLVIEGLRVSRGDDAEPAGNELRGHELPHAGNAAAVQHHHVHRRRDLDAEQRGQLPPDGRIVRDQQPALGRDGRQLADPGSTGRLEHRLHRGGVVDLHQVAGLDGEAAAEQGRQHFLPALARGQTGATGQERRRHAAIHGHGAGADLLAVHLDRLDQVQAHAARRVDDPAQPPKVRNGLVGHPRAERVGHRGDEQRCGRPEGVGHGAASGTGQRKHQPRRHVHHRRRLLPHRPDQGHEGLRLRHDGEQGQVGRARVAGGGARGRRRRRPRRAGVPARHPPDGHRRDDDGHGGGQAHPPAVPPVPGSDPAAAPSGHPRLLAHPRPHWYRPAFSM